MEGATADPYCAEVATGPATADLESSSSWSISSAPTKRRKMEPPSHPRSSQQPSSGVHVLDAHWPIENETTFVTLMYEEVVKGNVVGSKFTNTQWCDLVLKMRASFPNFHYTLTQLKGKSDRFKLKWKKFHKLLTQASGFGWDATTGNVVASEEAWAFHLQSNPSDRELRRKGLPLYQQLTTIFSPTTATGSAARSSAQHRSVATGSDPY